MLPVCGFHSTHSDLQVPDSTFLFIIKSAMLAICPGCFYCAELSHRALKKYNNNANNIICIYFVDVVTESNCLEVNNHIMHSLLFSQKKKMILYFPNFRWGDSN